MKELKLYLKDEKMNMWASLKISDKVLMKMTEKNRSDFLMTLYDMLMMSEKEVPISREG